MALNRASNPNAELQPADAYDSFDKPNQQSSGSEKISLQKDKKEEEEIEYEIEY